MAFAGTLRQVRCRLFLTLMQDAVNVDAIQLPLGDIGSYSRVRSGCRESIFVGNGLDGLGNDDAAKL
jgi:hypothetical protein